MNKRIVVLGLLVAIMSVSAFGAGFIGTPTAELKKGQWSAGYNYMYSDMDLDKTKTKWVVYLDGVFDDSGTEKVKIEDVKIHRHYFALGYGITDQWEVYFQLGGADVKTKMQWEGDDEWEGFNFDNDFAWGWGTRITLDDRYNVKWGVSAQMNWLNTSMDDKGSWDFGGEDTGTWKETLDFETYDLLIAFGPTADMGGWKLYGGPFYYYLSGDLESKGSDSDGYTWKTKSDLEADSNFGGFIGAQFTLAENTDITTELSFTGDSWAVGTGITWKF